MVNYIEYAYSKKGDIVDGTQVFATPFEYKSNKEYTSNKISQFIGDGSTTTWTISTEIAGNVSLTASAIDVSTLKIFSDEGILVKDTDYTVAGNVVTFKPSAPASGKVFIAKYDLEAVPAVAPELSIKIKNMPIVCEPRKLRATYGLDAAFELQKELTSKVA